VEGGKKVERKGGGGYAPATDNSWSQITLQLTTPRSSSNRRRNQRPSASAIWNWKSAVIQYALVYHQRAHNDRSTLSFVIFVRVTALLAYTLLHTKSARLYFDCKSC